jgi:hypothetical protein
LTPVKWLLLGLSIEFPKGPEETREDTELETRLWPGAEKRDMAGEAGAEVLTVIGISRESRCESMRDKLRIARTMPSGVADVVERKRCS